MRLFGRAPNTPDPNFLHVCLSIVCPFCISHCPQLAQLGSGVTELRKTRSRLEVRNRIHLHGGAMGQMKTETQSHGM
jgi:hypothetical protein